MLLQVYQGAGMTYPTHLSSRATTFVNSSLNRKYTGTEQVSSVNLSRILESVVKPGSVIRKTLAAVTSPSSSRVFVTLAKYEHGGHPLRNTSLSPSDKSDQDADVDSRFCANIRRVFLIPIH